MNATLPQRLDLITPPLKIELPRLIVCTELDEPTGGYHIEVVWRGALPPSRANDHRRDGEAGTTRLLEASDSALSVGEETTTLLVATAFLASFGISFKGGRLLMTSEELSGRVAIQSTLLGNLILPPAAEVASTANMCVGRTGAVSEPLIKSALAAADHTLHPASTTTQEEVDKAVVSFRRYYLSRLSQRPLDVLASLTDSRAHHAINKPPNAFHA